MIRATSECSVRGREGELQRGVEATEVSGW